MELDDIRKNMDALDVIALASAQELQGDPGLVKDAKVIRSAIDKALRVVMEKDMGLQAKIDSLMLEYCPDEMTPEQIAEWEKHQVVHSASTTDLSGGANTEGGGELTYLSAETIIASLHKRIVELEQELKILRESDGHIIGIE